MHIPLLGRALTECHYCCRCSQVSKWVFHKNMEVDVSKILKHWGSELSIRDHPVLSLTVDFSFSSASEELWLLSVSRAALRLLCGSPHHQSVPASASIIFPTFYLCPRCLMLLKSQVQVLSFPHPSLEPGERLCSTPKQHPAAVVKEKVENGFPDIWLLEHILNWSHLGHFRAV